MSTVDLLEPMPGSPEQQMVAEFVQVDLLTIEDAS